MVSCPSHCQGKRKRVQANDNDQGGGGGTGEGEAATAASSSGDEDDSGGLLDTLLDPVVLLLLAGVAAVAVGMTLRHGQGLKDDGDEKRVPSDSATAPHTPEGEILGGGGESRS